jgi:hypothetical protein
MLTQDRLKQLLQYDPETGIFTRIANTRRTDLLGKKAGRTHKKRGYCEINVDGRLYYAHRLAFLCMTGEMPAGEVDHINHVKNDNRWANLRSATVSENQQNRIQHQSNNKLKVMGVSTNGSGFRARINTDSGAKHIGTFKTPELAHAAYIEAKRKLHSGCTI